MFAKSDQTLVETHIVALYFGSDICQIKLGFVQVNPKSDRKMPDVPGCPTVISCSVCVYIDCHSIL